MESVIALLKPLRVLPVLTVNSAEQAVETSRALHRGGLAAVEITLRTSTALEAIEAVKAAIPDFLVGAGTLKTVADVNAVKKAGADFAVSPGLTRELAEAASQQNLAFLPGVATPSEILEGMALGFDCFKLFPAEAVGGIPLLKALAAPFSGIQFCPTGGINRENLDSYLALPNVICVGGSWMVKPQLIQAGQWSEIERLARELA
ncbi:bifunctional 4-hydroxy-2-oxoglutarate aldolase/2-dehydro-3-deoxy-phosphogluconate aldolase [Gilvimarinus sp. F26214L]|uniref:bifunctional 4-hydroxy-2-oxoglutarate aldolase/2-dehydro-3-deoxy-phosphogluconate aldolase n=1 Tax=Gilvimarinus sp. DZF01 TaxID=3461371 RepID=UPI0040457401